MGNCAIKMLAAIALWGMTQIGLLFKYVCKYCNFAWAAQPMRRMRNACGKAMNI